MSEENNLEEFLNTISKGKVILNIGSEEICPPCRKISPLFHELIKKNENITFIKVDIQKNLDIAAHFNVSSIPHFIALYNEERINEFKGANEEKLNMMVEQLNKL